MLSLRVNEVNTKVVEYCWVNILVFFIGATVTPLIMRVHSKLIGYTGSNIRPAKLNRDENIQQQSLVCAMTTQYGIKLKYDSVVTLSAMVSPSLLGSI